MDRPPATWRAILTSYPCPTCLAGPGEECRTYNGGRADMPHAARAGNAARCAKCGTRLPADHLDPFCPHCLLLRRLDVERYTTHQRRDE